MKYTKLVTWLALTFHFFQDLVYEVARHGPYAKYGRSGWAVDILNRPCVEKMTHLAPYHPIYHDLFITGDILMERISFFSGLPSIVIKELGLTRMYAVWIVLAWEAKGCCLVSLRRA